MGEFVGEGGFEPPTTSTQSSCTTGLCDSPEHLQPSTLETAATLLDGAGALVFDEPAGTPAAEDPMIDCETEKPNAFPQVIHVRNHTLRADVLEKEGSTDSAPGAHDYFDAALVACKTLTATWYAKNKGIALERVEAHVERDDSEERAGKYVLTVRLAFHGKMTEEERQKLYTAVGRCPIHRLMTTSDVVIETAPLEPAQG
jgi:putative redox protein